MEVDVHSDSGHSLATWCKDHDGGSHAKVNDGAAVGYGFGRWGLGGVGDHVWGGVEGAGWVE